LASAANATLSKKKARRAGIPAGLPSALRGELDRQVLQVNHYGAESPPIVGGSTMSEYQVTCISRDGPDPDYRIDEIGIQGQKYPIDTVIGWVRLGVHKLWVSNGAANARVGFRQHPTSGRYYLATEPDGVALNNLSSLPECP
jgi:hypothetical protein